MGGIVPDEEVALRNGSRVLIRPVQPAARDAESGAASARGLVRLRP